MDADHRNIVIYRASRLEALLDPLLTLMRQLPPEHVLAPHELIAAHPGMRRWLARELAKRYGARGICANLRIELTSAWLDRLALDVLGEEVVALRPYRREVLRWRIHALLPELADAQVRAYLGGEAASLARRRFQLADRLARLYTQYLVYRPDWLADWAQGRDGGVEAGFLAPLWRELRQRIGLPHRGELLQRLVATLDAARAPPLGAEPLHVFGLAHLAPSELAVLRAVARHRPVVLYVPDPCREFWGGLRDARGTLRERIRRDPAGADAEAAFLEQGHPLLAAWGRMGQHFMLALDDSAAAVDERHWGDQADAPELDTRLHRVQESIRQLDPALIVEAGDATAARADRSLRVHACHTRLRELEVLRDALLRERADDPTLEPSDIVVMMPDVQAYLPLLPAVFGEPGRADGPLPYHCSDVALARAHPLFEAFRRLLDLPQSRVTCAQVADLLTVPQVARRLGVSGDEVDALVRWLDDSRVAWGLDAAFRARFDVPAIAEHTFAWGMDRLLAGYLAGSADDEAATALALPDGSVLAPVAGVHGPQAAALGALDRLLVELDGCCADARATLRASAWAERLAGRIEALFLVDPLDADAREAKAMLLHAVALLASEPAEASLDPELAYPVVREILQARLDAVPERQRFLLGGVTFCGMVPQRSIPFRVVAVLGLNDGEFPRAGSDGGLDPMTRHRRLGDRDVRSDDRYLFLETLMSARDVLHLSYLGEGVRDARPRNPAAPLAELLAALDAGDATQARPWFVRHPLQPFDARYFDGRDPALFSHRRDLAAMRVGAGRALAPFIETAPAIDAAHAPDTVDAPDAAQIALAEVLAFYRAPARQVLTGALGLHLDALAENRLRESEPLDARFEAFDQVGKRLFLEGVSRAAAEPPEQAPDWLRLTGALPPGRLGEIAWADERAAVAALIDGVRAPDHPAQALFAAGLPAATPVRIDCLVDGRRVLGEVREVYRRDATHWLVEVQPRSALHDLDFRVRIDVFLRWALLRLAVPESERVQVCVVATPVARARAGGDWVERINAWDAAFVDAASRAAHGERDAMRADLSARVAGLIAFWRAAQIHPPWYFPATSWAALDEAPQAVLDCWAGDDHHIGERDRAPGYAHLLAGERDFSEAADYAQLRANALHLRALITFELAAGGAP